MARFRRTPVIAALLSAVTLGGAAVALGAYPPDPRNDVKACSGECSGWSVDLKLITLKRSRGNLLVTVSEYGPFQKAQPLYWPQLELYTKSSVPRRAPVPPFGTKSVADYSLYVGYGQSTNCATPQHSKTYSMGLYKGKKLVVHSIACTWPNNHTIVYNIPLATLGHPAKVRARAWQAGVRGPLDVAPNVPGFVSG